MNTTTVNYKSLSDMMGGIRINEPGGFAVRQITPLLHPYAFVVVFEYGDDVNRDDFRTLSETR